METAVWQISLINHCAPRSISWNPTANGTITNALLVSVVFLAALLQPISSLWL
jgi:hypothetical protein